MTSGCSRFQHSLVRQWIHVTPDYGGLLASTLQKTAESPQLQFLDGRGHSLRHAEADPHGPDCLADHRDFAVAGRVGSSMSLLCLSCSLLVVSRRAENCGFHSCSSCLVVYMPVVVHDKFGVFFGPCAQVHGQGCPPPLGGGRDTSSLLPGVLPPN